MEGVGFGAEGGERGGIGGVRESREHFIVLRLVILTHARFASPPLPPSQPFEAMNRADRERFNNESFLRDQEYARIQQEKRDNRNNVTDGDTTKRAGRQEQDAKRIILEEKR